MSPVSPMPDQPWSEPTEPGCLFVVSTPIGHPEDVTLRALRVLRDVEWILAEDPATTGALLARYGIETPVTSYHRLTMRDKTPVVLARLRGGRALALVCDAGTPLLCDPGAYLVRRALRAGLRVVPVPGASAAAAALSVSGFLLDQYVFVGRLPRAAPRRRALLRELRREPRPQVIFASSRELPAVLQAVDGRTVLVACNLTTCGERLLRGSARAVLSSLAATPAQGDVTLVVGPVRGRTPTRNRRRRR